MLAGARAVPSRRAFESRRVVLSATNTHVLFGNLTMTFRTWTGLRELLRVLRHLLLRAVCSEKLSLH